MTDPAPPPNPAPPSPRHFPGEDDLCEKCGYPLKGLNPDGDCPECGSAVDASHPRHRVGLPFASSAGVSTYVRTFIGVMIRPKRCFRNVRFSHRAARARLFLVVNTLVAATLCTIFFLGLATLETQLKLLIFDTTFYFSHFMNEGLVVFPVVLVAVPILTYIEVLGVAWFSRKRGWRVPLRHAERVACYASVGWLPGAAVLGVVMNLSQSGAIENLWATLGGNPVYGPDAAWGTVFLAGVAAMLGFETLVWVGVRQIKFANTRPADATGPDTSENAASAPRA